MSAEADIFDALFSRVEDLTFSPPIPVAWPNYKYTPVVGQKYIEARQLPNDTNRIMINGTTDRLMGILMLTLNFPINYGEELAKEDVDTIIDHFATDLRLSSGDTQLRITKRPSPRQGLNMDGWWKIPILIDYEAFA